MRDKSLRTYRNIILLMLLALVMHAAIFPVAGLNYWLHWIGGAVIPGLLLVYAVYLLPKRPWQR